MKKEKDFFQITEEIASKYQVELDDICRILSIEFKIPADVFLDGIKRGLSEKHRAGIKRQLSEENGCSKNFIFYLCAVFYFGFFTIFGSRPKGIKLKRKFIFDIWHPQSKSQFYNALIEKIEPAETGFMVNTRTKQSRSSGNLTNSIITANFLPNAKVCGTIVGSMVRNARIFFLIARKLPNSFLLIIVTIFKRISLFQNHAQMLACDFYISAGDNYFDAIRHFVYKSGGIKNIVILQNGFRSGRWSDESVDLYTHCDFYFGFGTKQIEVQKGMNAKHKHAIGSIKLHQLKLSRRFIEGPKLYDIVFLGGGSQFESLYFRPKTYLEILDNLIKLKARHPQLRIFYSDKKLREQNEFQSVVNSLLKTSQITTTDENISDSYDAVNSAAITLFYRTSMGFEALCFDTTVLNINYDKDSFPFSPSDNELILTDRSYIAFEERILRSLSQDRRAFESKRRLYCKKYMNNINVLCLPDYILQKIQQPQLKNGI